MRRLVNRFFDALEAGDIQTVADCYAPDMTMWVNLTGETSAREDNLRVLTEGKGLHRRRTYNDRNINTFDDGFVVQYSCNVTAHNGTNVTLSSCLVGQVWEGKIVKLYEYMDSSKFTARPSA